MSSSNLTTVRAIGAGARLSDVAVPVIVATLPADFDATAKTARKSVTEAVHVWSCGTDKRPAQKVGRAGEQVTTDYGRGVDCLVSAVMSALKSGTDKPKRLAVTLSGTGVNGGTSVIGEDHALYGALMELFASTEA